MFTIVTLAPTSATASIEYVIITVQSNQTPLVVVVTAVVVALEVVGVVVVVMDSVGVVVGVV